VPDDYLDSDETIDTVVADSSTPRVFGILNIIFSLLAMCWGAYTLFTALVLPNMFESMEVAQVAAQEEAAEELETLKADIAEASTEEEKGEG